MPKDDMYFKNRKQWDATAPELPTIPDAPAPEESKPVEPASTAKPAPVDKDLEGAIKRAEDGKEPLTLTSLNMKISSVKGWFTRQFNDLKNAFTEYITDSDKRVEAVESELNKNKDSILSIKSDVEALKKRPTGSLDVSALTSRVEALEKKPVASVERVNDVAKAYDSVNSKARMLGAELEACREENEALKNKIADLSKTVSDLSATVTRQEGQIETLLALQNRSSRGLFRH